MMEAEARRPLSAASLKEGKPDKKHGGPKLRPSTAPSKGVPSSADSKAALLLARLGPRPLDRRKKEGEVLAHRDKESLGEELRELKKALKSAREEKAAAVAKTKQMAKDLKLLEEALEELDFARTGKESSEARRGARESVLVARLRQHVRDVRAENTELSAELACLKEGARLARLQELEGENNHLQAEVRRLKYHIDAQTDPPSPQRATPKLQPRSQVAAIYSCPPISDPKPRGGESPGKGRLQQELDFVKKRAEMLQQDNHKLVGDLVRLQAYVQRLEAELARGGRSLTRTEKSLGIMSLQQQGFRTALETGNSTQPAAILGHDKVSLVRRVAQGAQEEPKRQEEWRLKPEEERQARPQEDLQQRIQESLQPGAPEALQAEPQEGVQAHPGEDLQPKPREDVQAQPLEDLQSKPEEESRPPPCQKPPQKPPPKLTPLECPTIEQQAGSLGGGSLRIIDGTPSGSQEEAVASENLYSVQVGPMSTRLPSTTTAEQTLTVSSEEAQEGTPSNNSPPALSESSKPDAKVSPLTIQQPPETEGVEAEQVSPPLQAEKSFWGVPGGGGNGNEVEECVEESEEYVNEEVDEFVVEDYDYGLDSKGHTLQTEASHVINGGDDEAW